MRHLLILKLGDTLPDLAARRGDFEDWFVRALELEGSQYAIHDPRHSADRPSLEHVAGVVLTGSHAMVTERAGWSERTAEWLRSVVDAGVPVLGVCYGHQLLAHALGGEVGDNPRGTQEGITTIALNDDGLQDPLFAGIERTFAAPVSHSQSVLRLPPGAISLGADAWDPNQAVRFSRRAWGVQFHPEMDAEMTRAYVRATGWILRAEGQDPDRLLAEVRETPTAASVLPRFAALCRPLP